MSIKQNTLLVQKSGCKLYGPNCFSSVKSWSSYSKSYSLNELKFESYY